MRLSWRTQQFRAADRQDSTAALGMPEPWIHRAAVTGHLLLILLVAVVLRIRGLDRYSLWYDEVVTMRLARTANPAALIQLLGQIDGTRAPLHPLILQGWLRLFGTSELAGRSFSAVFGISPFSSFIGWASACSMSRPGAGGPGSRPSVRPWFTTPRKQGCTPGWSC